MSNYERKSGIVFDQATKLRFGKDELSSELWMMRRGLAKQSGNSDAKVSKCTNQFERKLVGLYTLK